MIRATACGSDRVNQIELIHLQAAIQGGTSPEGICECGRKRIKYRSPSARRRKPTDNAVIESFNERFREECPNARWFESLAHAQHKVDARRWDY